MCPPKLGAQLYPETWAGTKFLNHKLLVHLNTPLGKTFAPNYRSLIRVKLKLFEFEL